MKRCRAYVLIQTAVETNRAYQLGIVEQNKWSNALFEKYMQQSKDDKYLSKKDIERWGFLPPCGPRVQVVDIEFPCSDAWSVSSEEMR